VEREEPHMMRASARHKLSVEFWKISEGKGKLGVSRFADDSSSCTITKAAKYNNNNNNTTLASHAMANRED